MRKGADAARSEEDDHLTGSGTVRYSSLGEMVLNDRRLFVGGQTSIPYSYKVYFIADTNMSFGIPGTSSTRLEGGMILSEPGYADMNMLIEPLGDRSTRLTFSGAGQISGAMKLMTPMIRSQMSKEIAAAQQRIKAMVEAE